MAGAGPAADAGRDPAGRPIVGVLANFLFHQMFKGRRDHGRIFKI
jgi:hypothetical protein